MKLLFKFTMKLFKQSYYSIRSAHYLVLLLSFLIYYLFKDKINIDFSKEYISILNTVGILSTFYILAIEKLNFKELVSRYKNMVKSGILFGRKTKISQGDQITNTFFSFIIIEVVLLSVQYILYIFNLIYPLLLILSIMYMTVGFILAIGTWHGIEIIK